MIEKINIKNEVNAVGALFQYKRIGTLNNHMLNVLERLTFIFIKAPMRCSIVLKVNLILSLKTE